ncbi:MAG: FAD-binding oxidoreductase [Nitrososphaerota archaeon]
MATSNNFLRELVNKLGQECVSVDSLEKLVYAHDLAALPKSVKLLFNTTPDAIARPRSIEHVAEIIRLANEYKIPVIARGGATWGFGGTVPVRGGIILDLTGLNRVVNLDEKNGLLTVECGVVWEDIMRFLQETNWELPTYPSSALSSTVGGWAATGGIGYGSLKYGPFVKNVAKVTAVLPDGRVVVADDNSNPNLSQLFGSEGILCIFADLTLKLIPKSEVERPFMANFSNFANAVMAAQEVLRLTNPHSLVLRTFGFVRAKDYIESDTYFFGCFNGNRYDVDRQHLTLGSIVNRYRGYLTPEDEARREWEERFYTLRIKKWGPSILGNEFIIPVHKILDIVKYCWHLGNQAHLDVEVEVMFISRDKALMFQLFLCDERKSIRYLTEAAITKKVLDAAIKAGGKPYGYGLWNFPFMERAEPEKKRELKSMKGVLDPQNVLNPGKTIGAELMLGIPLPGKLYSTFMDGVWVLRKVV